MNRIIKLAGVDLAWRSIKNPTAIVIGSLDNNGLSIDKVIPAEYGITNVFDTLIADKAITGIAIDAPLIIENKTGQRTCEKEIGVTYGSRKASCHTSNTSLFPSADSVTLSKRLLESGFDHAVSEKWQIECYPHPALIEIFGLKERLKYKKGKVLDKKNGQIELGFLINSLSSSPIIKLNKTENLFKYTNEAYIKTLKGKDLKSNEDVLDAIICLYIAALYSTNNMGRIFGDIQTGYIWVPEQKCIL